MRTSFPVEKIRADFPILKESNRGKPLAYLDNAASSQKPKCVIDSISRFYEQANSNVHRGIYQLAEIAEYEYTQARETIAELVLCQHPGTYLHPRNDRSPQSRGQQLRTNRLEKRGLHHSDRDGTPCEHRSCGS